MKTNNNKNFNALLHSTKMFMYGLSRGTILFTPRSFALWEAVQTHLNWEFKKLRVQNVQFPALIPLTAFQKEKDNFQGFAPELMKITQIGDKKLNENEIMTLRPTSEVLFSHYFRKNLQSYRDLPILLNQWTNVWRWEKNTYPFLRTTEFLWQEGHTVHENKILALSFIKKIIHIYHDFIENKLLIPTIFGEKSINERFAGASLTYSFETLLPDGQFLQLATAHHLGTKFAKVFDIFYLNRKNERVCPEQTSWGLSTRILAGALLTHRDAKGLVLPPAIADYQIVLLIPFIQNKEQKLKVNKYLDFVTKILQNLSYRFKIEFGDQKKSLGYWINEYEKWGIPLRMEIGIQVLKNQSITYVTRLNQKRQTLFFEHLTKDLGNIFKNLEQQMKERALKQMKAKEIKVRNYQNYLSIPQKNQAYLVNFCGNIECENKIQQETQTTSRVLFSLKKTAVCFHCHQSASYQAFFGRSY